MSIVHAKTKVALISPAGTNPRLELCGAQILSELLTTAMKSLDVPVQDAYAWCDSAIVLCWLYMPPERLSTYVSNWVSDTTARIPSTNWRHVPTSSNPADLLSRSKGPKELVNSKLWWQVPEWLLQGPENWPSRTDWRQKSKDLPELKKVVMTVEPPDNALLSRFSSYTRLLRVMTWGVRFLFNLMHSIEERRLSHLLTLQEKGK